ncbi:MAG: DNRLRE domain-containing protein [Planctomycetota bacterium]|nr:DNRLRE domain-containing protein [Planctomycetota bacterium]
MKSLPTLASALLLAIAPALTACGGGGSGDSFIKPGEETAALAMWIWLAADQDTPARCQGPFCNGGDTAYGTDPLLDAGETNDEIARSYMRFTMPDLPAGTTVEEAYLGMFQAGGSRATRGTAFLGIVPVEDPWDPNNLTYNTQPRSFLGQNEFNLTPVVDENGWWTSPNIKRYVDYKLANPQLNYGFVTTYAKGVDQPTAPVVPNIFRFRSNNFGNRTPTQIGTGPRIVIKVILPQGATVNDVSLPPLQPGHDLATDASGKAARALLRVGADWPADWQVR